MHPLEQLILWLIASDIIWGALVALWVAIGIPIALIAQRKKNRK